MDTSIEYRVMCQAAIELQGNWYPNVGDYFTTKHSYCNEDEPCSDEKLCAECLRMANTYVVSGKFNFHESVGGTHWYFGGHSCVRSYGNRMNSTACYVMTKERHDYEDNDFNRSSYREMLWLPRQDQLLDLVQVGFHLVEKVKGFSDFVEKITQIYTYSLEQLSLMYYMKLKYTKSWNPLNSKFDVSE